MVRDHGLNTCRRDRAGPVDKMFRRRAAEARLIMCFVSRSVIDRLPSTRRFLDLCGQIPELVACLGDYVIVAAGLLASSISADA